MLDTDDIFLSSILCRGFSFLRLLSLPYRFISWIFCNSQINLFVNIQGPPQLYLSPNHLGRFMFLFIPSDTEIIPLQFIKNKSILTFLSFNFLHNFFLPLLSTFLNSEFTPTIFFFISLHLYFQNLGDVNTRSKKHITSVFVFKFI